MRVNTQHSARHRARYSISLVSGPASRLGSLNLGETEAPSGLQGAPEAGPASGLSWNFPVWMAGTRQLLRRSWLRSVNASGKVLLHRSETQLDPSSPSPVASQLGQRITGPAQAKAIQAGGTERGQPGEGSTPCSGWRPGDRPTEAAWKQHPSKEGRLSSASPGAPTPLTAASPEVSEKVSCDRGTRLRK